MKRRVFGTLVGGMATSTAWPPRLGAQPTAPPTIGYLSSATAEGFAHFVAAFRRGLEEAGYVEGRNLAIEYRWKDDQHNRLPAQAADLVARRVAVIAATGGSEPALAAKAATSVIPIVFTGGADPVKLGLVASLGRPGGNATGVVNFSSALAGKRFELLCEMVPTAAVVGVLVNPTGSHSAEQLREIREAAKIKSRSIHVVSAGVERDFDAGFATLVEQRAAALFVISDPFFTGRRARLVALAAHHAMPASYGFRDFPLVGGLMSYGTNLLDVHRQAGVYAGRILKGAKPADLPVLQPTKFDLVINLKTARALGLAIPPSILARADEVIE